MKYAKSVNEWFHCTALYIRAELPPPPPPPLSTPLSYLPPPLGNLAHDWPVCINSVFY